MCDRLRLCFCIPNANKQNGRLIIGGGKKQMFWNPNISYISNMSTATAVTCNQLIRLNSVMLTSMDTFRLHTVLLKLFEVEINYSILMINIVL